MAPVVTEAAQKLPPAEVEQSGLITESNSRAWPTLVASARWTGAAVIAEAEDPGRILS
jgi:hypothetical protein